MRNTLLGAHFLFAGIWLGCVLTEALFERALLAGDRRSHLRLAALHMRVDKYIELPAIFIVLFTGTALWFHGHSSGTAATIMVFAGLVAIAANLFCVALVLRRHSAAQSGDWLQFDQLDHLQHKIGGLVLVGLLVALCAGIWARGASQASI
ncbi:MAG: hypothetical protein KBA96_05775 [Rhodocyclaceae bacterium]|nr:hypothetical protein [Rhodocyclaceae bacterium]